MASSSRYAMIAEGSAAGLLFLVSPVCGYFFGRAVGRWLGLGMFLAYTGAVLGMAAAFVNLLRLVARVSR